MKTRLWLVVLSLGLAGHVARAAADEPAAGSAESPIALVTGAGTLRGSLRLPPSSGKVPVVLIIAGSGPTDRDGNSRGITGRNDSLKLLAQALADAGFASVRYDKRGIAASADTTTRELDLRFETYVQDAAAWARRLASDPRFSAVAIVGHSEGSLIGMLAARQAGAAAYVSIAGPATSAPALLRAQLAGKLPAELADRNEQILHALEDGKLVDDIPQPLAPLYRPSVQPYLISWFKYTPSKEITALTMPIAIFQGDTDIQVPVSEATQLSAAKPDAELHVIAGMNHVLKTVPPDRLRQLASYGDPTLPLSTEFVQQLDAFLRQALPADGRR